MRITLYTRDDCSLCDSARQQLSALQEAFPHQLVEVNVDSNAELKVRFGEHVPVVQAGPYTLRAPFDEKQLQVTLASARDSQQRSLNRMPAKQGSDRNWAIFLNRMVLGFARHWLAVFTLIVGFYVSMPILAPVMMKLGMTGPASVVYRVYSPMCHQFAFRSFFLFGDQPAYPRELAGSTLTSYGTATGLDEWDVFQARAFVGNEKIGYKMALCERDISIYLGIVFAGLAYGVARRFFKVKPLPLALWALLGIAPIALDGGSQLLSQIPALPLAMRESTPWLRSITGALFGMMNVWMAYPYVEQSMVETRLEIASKLAIAEEETRIQQAEF